MSRNGDTAESGAESEDQRVSAAARALRDDNLSAIVRGLEGRIDNMSAGVKLELEEIKGSIQELGGIVRGMAAVVGRVDREKESDRAAVRDVASAIAELHNSGVRRMSSGEFDAQALTNTLELQGEQHRGDMAALTAALQALTLSHTAEVAALKKEIGVAPDKVRDIKGEGILGQLHEVNSAKSIATIAIGTFLAGGGVAAAILQLFGGK